MCEDIRDEVGAKKTLVGVISGDVVAESFPAIIQIAIYLEYLPEADDGEELNINFRLFQNDKAIMQGRSTAKLPAKHSVTVALPRGLVNFSGPATISLKVSVNKRDEIEILRRGVIGRPADS